MNNNLILSRLVFMTIIGSFVLGGCISKKPQTKLLLYSTPWAFSDASPLSMLSSQQTKSTFQVPHDSSNFTVRIQVDLKAEISDEVLLDIPGVLKLRVYQHDVKDRKYQNYPAYPMPDGSVPVLEAALKLYPPIETKARDMVVGVPLGIMEKPQGQHSVVLHFSGVKWSLYIDNELLDNDFPLGYPKWGAQSTWQIAPSIVSRAEIFFSGAVPLSLPVNKPRIASEIQYWTPQGHNAWVGDVATFYHEGRYHLFYLFDRRGHGSKFGKGGHYFEHLSTTDFKTWTEHEAATPIEEQWETFGTGTPFIFDNKLSISYGLHTTRIYPKEKTTLPLLWDHYNKHGLTGSFRYDTLSGYPAGSTYSISQDGISKFKKTKVLFHPCENPSVYTDPEGHLRMLANYGAKGTWGSESITGGWKSINPNFPPGGDCTFFFRWGNYDYVIGGFTGFWSKPASAPEDQFTDGVKAGTDFYNGMNVPAVTEIKNGRFLLAGWIPVAGWGGALAIHEMVRLEDGKLGTKWMDEITPVTQEGRSLAKKITSPSTFATGSSSFLLQFDVFPGAGTAGKLGALLSGTNSDDQACEMQIDLKSRRAQYGKGELRGYANTEKSLREGGSPQGVRNYAIENLSNIEKPFTVRIMVKYDHKFGGSLIDTEIAGKRTMITFRPGLKVENLLLRSEENAISNVRIAALKN